MNIDILSVIRILRIMSGIMKLDVFQCQTNAIKKKITFDSIKEVYTFFHVH